MKNIFLFLGSMAGIYSFLRLLGQDVFKFIFKPRLVIEFNHEQDVKSWRVGPPYLQSVEIRRVVTVRVRNTGKKPALDCEGMIEIFDKNVQSSKMLPLHWADTPYDALSSSVARVIIGKLPRRLDVLFSQEGFNIRGCSVASAQALATGVQRDQFFLPEGEYKAKIHISHDSGSNAAESFILKSSGVACDLCKL